jgi:stearoyl-CoA desaturase (delta-9 desaturase)
LLLTLCGVLAAQNGPLWWVGHHRHHHRHADHPDDTHSPRAGFFWSHMGWLFSTKCLPVRFNLVPDLRHIPEMRWLERNYYLVTLGYAGVRGLQLVVWGSVLSTVCCYHFVWSTNSVGHRFGTRRYPTSDDSRNNILIALLTLGDGWHHNHHHYPPSARHGFRWWELDITFVVLRVFAAVGIVWDLKLPPSRIRKGG